MASQSSGDNGIASGQTQPSTPWGEFNRISFLVGQMLGKVQTCTLVRIEKCTNSGGMSPVGFVDVTPLVNQVDGEGKSVPHETVFNIPYFRLQGGTDAVIMDPKPGDIGVCVFASRDISRVKATKRAANPGSYRQFSFSDGLYLGGMLNGSPVQYVQFSSTGIKIHSPSKITLEAPQVEIEAQTVEVNASTSTTVTTPTFTVNGATVLNGTLSQQGGGNSTFSGNLSTPTGDVTAQGVSLHNHTHGGVQTGTGQTGSPT